MLNEIYDVLKFNIIVTTSKTHIDIIKDLVIYSALIILLHNQSCLQKTNLTFFVRMIRNGILCHGINYNTSGGR